MRALWKLTLGSCQLLASGKPARAPRPAPRRRSFFRYVLLLLLLILPLLSSGSVDARSPLERGLARVTQSEQFSLVGWEVDALAERALRPFTLGWTPGLDTTADRDLVFRYVKLTDELGQASAERDRIAATSRDAAQLSAVDQRASGLSSERAAIRPRVEMVIGWQLEQILEEQGIRRGFFELRARSDSPLPDLRVAPPVAFRLGDTPNLLVVSPRTRIELVDSVLLDADLSFHQVDAIEADADTLDVASLVTGIGGLAAYPAMIPASSSLTWTLQTVAHEWMHHLLAFRPLGQVYFSSYEMRTINETVADLVGQELGRLVYARYYSPPAAPWPEPPPAPATTAPTQPTFSSLMRDIRVRVEAMLARGDVAGAEAYMTAQQADLAQRGYYVRRLNTAYLSFFGAYSGSANPYEEKLRALRSSSRSLADFVDAVSTVGDPGALTKLESGGG
jgi:hypothetical protein